MQTYLVLTALGDDDPGIITHLSKAIMNSGCNIIDSRMAVVGGKFTMLLLTSGSWDAIVRLEGALPALQERLGLSLIARRSEAPQPSGRIPYLVEVVALDHPGIVHWLADFFTSRNVTIHEMSSSRYEAEQTGSHMFTLSMSVHLPPDTHIPELRDEFLDFCDELNLDAVMEAIKR
ncbi:glycine cleavage system protein R [Ectothiorhodospiraceae bacterium 2226]|nr:glycine cleavage system protein R [Ectothiorhodospiraceae bacterium 2226]